MALDPSIILQAGRGVTPLLSPTEIQDQQMQRELGGYKLNQLRQASADDAAYRNVLASGGDDLPNKLLKAGLGKHAQEYQKFQADQQKAKLDSETGQLKNAGTKSDLIGQVLGGVSDQASYEQGIKQLNAMGIPTPQAPPQYDPAVVKQFWQQALSAKDKQAAETTRRGQDITMRGQDLTQGTTLRGQDLSRDTALRGQDLTDSRSREANQSGRVPSGYRQNPDGSLSFIPGGPADPNTKPAGGKPLNDTQAKALQFGSRMQVAGEILDKLAEDGVNTSVPGSRAGFGVGAVISALQPEQRQQLDQAKRDFINAVLRRESGAAISPSEFDSAEKQYFPQPGEGPTQRAQKKANRELATRGILAEVPDSETRVAQVRGGGASEPLKGLKGAKSPSADLGGLEAELKRRGLLK
jgi:hypothetical protein